MNSQRKRINIVSLEMVKESSLLYSPRQCGSVQQAYDLIRTFIEKKDREHLIVIGLNAKNEPTLINYAHIGTVNQSIAAPRDILKPILLSNSVRYLIGHNHPSGNPEPSQQDIQLTNRLHEASELLGIKLLDHLIIGDDAYYSFREDDRLNFP